MTTVSKPTFNSFAEFWPHYVKEHSQPETRALHALGTTASMACAVAFIVRRQWKLLPLALVPGYAAAWTGHFLIEKNRPATFDHPLWSLMGDCKMLGLMLSGKMEAEIEHLQARRPSEIES